MFLSVCSGTVSVRCPLLGVVKYLGKEELRVWCTDVNIFESDSRGLQWRESIGRRDVDLVVRCVDAEPLAKLTCGSVRRDGSVEYRMRRTGTSLSGLDT